MADLKKTIEIIFSATDKTASGIQSSAGAIQSFGQSVQSVTSPIAGFTSTLIKAELAVGALAVGLGAIAFNQSVAFESATLDLAKVLDSTEGSVESFTAEMSNLALEFGVASTELIQSQANFVQAGFSARDSANLVRDSLNLVIAGDIEAAEASELLIASLKGFNAPASEAARLTDILNEVSNNYATNVKELAIGMAGISPIASQMGFSFEETAGILTPVIEVFRSGSQASIALKTGLLRLVDDAKPVQDALASIGVAQRDANGNLRSGKDILADVSVAFQSADENQKLFLTSQLVGIDQAARMVKVFDGLAQSNEITATGLNSSGSAAKEVAIRLASAEAQINRARVAFSQLAVAIGNEFRTELTGVISGVSELAQSFRDVVRDGGLDPLFDLLRPNLEELERTLRAIAKNLPEAFSGVDFTKLADSFGELGGSLGELFGVDLTTVDGLRDALQFLADSLATLTTFVKGAVEGIEPFVEKAFELADAVSKIDPEIISLAGNIGGVGLALNTVLPALDTALLTFIALGGVGGAIPKLVTSIKSLSLALAGPAGLVVGATAVGTAVGDITHGLVDSNDTFISASDSVFKFVDSLFGVNRGADATSSAINTLVDATLKKKKADEEAEKSTKKLTKELTVAGNESLLTADGLDAATESAELLAKEQDVAAKAVEKYSDAVVSSVEGLSDYEKAVQGLAPVTQEIVEEWQKGEDALDSLGRSQDGVNLVFKDGVAVFTQVSKAQKENADTLEDLAKKGEIAKDKYAELVVELQKAEIEAQVKLDIAEVEAGVEKTKAQLATFKEVTQLQLEFDIEKVKQDTEKVKALITGITDAAEIVSSNIQHVIDAIAGLDSADDLAESKFEIFRKQLELENNRLDEQLRNQTRLTDAQVKELEARTERLRSGDAVIKIDGAGLQPELEAFMFRILSSIQVRANSDAQSFLLGIAG